MDIHHLRKAPFQSCRVENGRAGQQPRQAEQDGAANQRQGDSLDISEAGRNALREKMSAVKRSERAGDIKKLSSINSGAYGIMNEFEKAMAETDFAKEEGTDAFDSHVNKMAAAYQLMKDRIEEKYAAADRQEEYYTAADGSMQELTKEKELEMLDKAYEAHSRFMAASTQIWCELQDFKARTTSHSGGAEEAAPGAPQKSTEVKEQVYRAFMSAVSEENLGLLKQEKGSRKPFRLQLDISSSARSLLNSIWDYQRSSVS